MTVEDKMFALVCTLLLVGGVALAALESWSDVERARHGCVEKK